MKKLISSIGIICLTATGSIAQISGGRVGIGTPTPNTLLEVRATSGQADMELNANVTGGNNAVLRLNKNGASSYSIIRFKNKDTAGWDMGTQGDNNFKLKYFPTNSTIIDVDDATKHLSFFTNDYTEPVNVGGNLSVFGSVIAKGGSGGVVVKDRNLSNYDGWNWYATGGRLRLYRYTSGGDLLTVAEDGNLGIGTTTPDLAGLVVNKREGAVCAMFGNNNIGVAIEDNYPGIGFNSYYNGGRKAINTGYGSLVGQDPTTGRFYISTSATSVSGQGTTMALNDRLVIKADGSIGVQGNTDPHAPLTFANTVGGKISLYGSSANANYGIGVQGFQMQLYTDASSADIVLGYGGSSNFSENMRVKGNGNVGIGTNAPGAKLEVAGKVKASQRIFLDDAAVEISGAIKVSGSNKPAFQINMGTLAGNPNFFQVGTGANQIDYYRITTSMIANDPDAIINVTPVSSRLSFPFWVGYDANNTIGGGSGQWYLAEPHNSSGVGGFTDGMRFNIMIMTQ